MNCEQSIKQFSIYTKREISPFKSLLKENKNLFIYY